MHVTLLESGRIIPLRSQVAFYGGTAAQVVFVFALAAGLRQWPATSDQSAPVDRPTFLAPLFEAKPKPVQEQLSYVALGGIAQAAVRETVGVTAVSAPTTDVAIREQVGGGDSRPPADVGDDASNRAYSEIEVDSAVVRDPDSEGPLYPPTLLAKRIEGFAVVSFVVDTTGRPDLRSFMPLEVSDTLFANAVRLALPRMKFTPAKRSGIRVRQEVEQRFTFRIPKP
jgi:TonB family protein